MRRFGLIFFLLLICGCDRLPFGYTDIGKIRETPAAFENREVKIRGVVTDVARIPFLEVQMYTLRDDTGEITVMTLENLPAPNVNVAVRGKVQSAAIVGGESFGVRVKETERLPAPFW